MINVNTYYYNLSIWYITYNNTGISIYLYEIKDYERSYNI